MGKHEKRVYLEAIGKRYRRAMRADKGKILDEFCSVCGYQRKYAIRCWEANLASHHGVLDVLRNTTNRRCSRYCAGYGLQPIRCAASAVAAMPLWLPHYEMRFGVLDESTPIDAHGYFARQH